MQGEGEHSNVSKSFLASSVPDIGATRLSELLRSAHATTATLRQFIRRVHLHSRCAVQIELISPAALIRGRSKGTAAY